jgi:succinyl-diaminopimelate desuccinylase
MTNDTNYTVEEVAGKLKVSKKTILREIARGKLKTEKVGRRHLVVESALNNYLNKEPQELTALMNRYFDDKKGEMVSLLQKMVSMPSETSELIHEERLARYIKKTFDKWGIRSVVYSNSDAVAVRATVGYADEGILLDAPLDTLPPGDLSKWNYPPFDGVIKAGKMYGRGTADAKAGIVCMMYTALFFKMFVDEESFRIELVFDGGEQNGEFLGIKEVLKRGLPAKYGIIGYSGDENDVLIGARGYHRYTFKANGKAVHTGSRFKKGINAISQIIRLISDAEKIKLPKSKNELFSFGSRLTFSLIEGGRAINMVPDECTARVDVRTVPEVTRADLDKIWKTLIPDLKNKDPEMNIEFFYDVGEEAYLVSRKDKFVENIVASVVKHSKEKPRLTASGPAHIGNLLYDYGVSCVVWGPVGTNVHSYDEYIEIASLPLTSKIYAETIIKHFGIDSSQVPYSDST